MRRIRWVVLVIGALLMGLVGTSHGSVEYTLTDLGINDNETGTHLWQNDYIVRNTSSKDLTEFSVYFDYGLYFNLIDYNPNPGNWTTLAVSPYDSGGTPYPGFFNGQLTTGSLASGDTATGFSVQFVSLAPTVQDYLITFSDNTTEQGQTMATPEPTTWMLLTISLGAVMAVRRKM